MDGTANPLMDRKVVGVVLFGEVAGVTSPATAESNPFLLLLNVPPYY
jgi:hypothetical protein